MNLFERSARHANLQALAQVAGQLAGVTNAPCKLQPVDFVEQNSNLQGLQAPHVSVCMPAWAPVHACGGRAPRQAHTCTCAGAHPPATCKKGRWDKHLQQNQPAIAPCNLPCNPCNLGNLGSPPGALRHG